MIHRNVIEVLNLTEFLTQFGTDGSEQVSRAFDFLRAIGFANIKDYEK